MRYRTNQFPPSRFIHMSSGELHCIADGIGTLIACLEGRVWITQDDDQRDIILSPGETFRLDRQGTAIINACGKAAIATLPEPAPSRWAA